MDSSTIRWAIAGLFVAFLAIVVLSDLIRSKPKRAKKPEGFRHMHPQSPASKRQKSWKTPIH